jgi:queuine tRNA-ribosyltransferase
MGKITDNEVFFRSPIDGSRHTLTPEKSIQIQFDLGVDMMVCLDDPPPNNYSKEKISKAVERTIRWAERCMIEYDKQLKERGIKEEERPLIFCVVQGGEYVDLRKKCAKGLTAIGDKLGRLWDGYGFGARHIDDNGIFLDNILKKTASFIPKKSLRFALGVGSPEDIVRCYEMGWDMFDCVIPTREGRHGSLFVRKSGFKNSQSKIGNVVSKTKVAKKNTSFYETINIGNRKYKEDFSSVDKEGGCELCGNYTRAYLSHLFKSGDPLGMRLAAMHNLYFYTEVLNNLKEGSE